MSIMIHNGYLGFIECMSILFIVFGAVTWCAWHISQRVAIKIVAFSYAFYEVVIKGEIEDEPSV